MSSTDAKMIAAGEPLINKSAFTVTPELMIALDYGSDLIEDAEFAAMVIASVAGLSAHGERIVLVAEINEDHTSDVVDPENGEIILATLAAGTVVAFFCDDTDADCSAAARASSGLSIDEAWEREEVQDLLNSSDLLWHGVEELNTLFQN